MIDNIVPNAPEVELPAVGVVDRNSVLLAVHIAGGVELDKLLRQEVLKQQVDMLGVLQFALPGPRRLLHQTV